MQQSPQMPIIDVAELVGYKDPLHFSKSFKKIVGQSPTEYRQNLAAQAQELETEL